MSLKCEKLEHNMAKLTIEAPAEEFEKSVNNAYKKNKSRISVPGFRRGKAPRNIIEKLYGKDVFYSDAANDLMSEVYAAELSEHKELDVVSRPQVDIVQMEAGKTFIFTADVALKPPVDLGKYKGVKIDKSVAEVTEEELNKEMEHQRENNSRILAVEEPRPIKNTDIATIDYEGFVDGEPFEGGRGTDYDLHIGSHTFIDTFEDQLIGHSVGDDVEVNVTFPENYQEPSLQSKNALFKVQIKALKEKKLPELDDEFASEVSEFDTLEEYREDLKKKMQDRRFNEAKARMEDEAVHAVVNDSKMDIPDAMVGTEAEMLYNNFMRRIQQQGMTPQMYMQYTGMNRDALIDDMKIQARRNIESRLVLEAVVEAEGIEASDEEYQAELERIASGYHMEPAKLEELMGDEEKENTRKDICIQKAADLLVEQSVQKEQKEQKDQKQE